MAELHEFEQLAGAAVDLGAAESLQVQGEGDVFQAGERGQEVEELEDEADFVAAEAGEIVIGEGGDGLAVDADLARGGAVQAADEIEEGGLAGARGSDDGDHLAARDFQMDGFERSDLAFPVVELGDAREGNHRCSR